MSTVTVNGVTLSVFDEGTGPPILFVHGFPLNHTMWRRQLEHFAASHRVIAPDLRGFGASPCDDSVRVLTMQQHAEDLNALLDQLGVREPVCYCGLSMGGYVGWQFLKLFGARLSSLIVCDSRAAADTPDGVEGRKKLADTVLRHGVEPVANAMLPKLIAESSARENKDLVAQLWEMIVDTEPATIAAALLGMAERPDATEMLSRISIPTLYIVGSDDQLSAPDEMRSMAEKTPSAEFAEIPGAGHMSPQEQPDAVNAVMEDFLRRGGG
jgi:pimeloyl-ACP methyl ester carboxylesterase